MEGVVYRIITIKSQKEKSREQKRTSVSRFFCKPTNQPYSQLQANQCKQTNASKPIQTKHWTGQATGRTLLTKQLNFMQAEQLNNIIKELTILQIQLMRQRRDHNGQVLQHDDIDHINITIEILSNLIKDNTHIWKNKTKSVT